MNIGVDTLTDHPRCELTGRRIVPRPVAFVTTLGEAPPMLSASIQRLRYGRLKDSRAAHRAQHGVRCSPCRRGDGRADLAKCTGCARAGLVGPDAWRIRLRAYFSVVSFGAGSCATPKGRHSVRARANMVLRSAFLRRSLDKDPILQLLVTIAAFMVLEDLQQMICGGQPYFVSGVVTQLGTISVAGVTYARYQLHGEQIPCIEDFHVVVLREPYRVTAHILPWNYPAQMFGRSAVPAR